jgi:ribokinase
MHRFGEPHLGPIVVVGAHVQGLFLRVEAVPREGETVLGYDFSEPLDGGKGTHQAIAAARMGAPTAFVTVLGRDERGVRWRAFLESEGIDCRGIIESNRPTDVGFVMLPPNGIPAIATALDANRDLNATSIQEAAWLIRTASLVICQLEAPLDAAIAAFRIAREAGARTIFNPAPAAELNEEVLRLTDILVPNEHEAAALAGRQGTPSDLALALARRCPDTTVVVTAGAAGVFVMDMKSGAFHVPALRVAMVDTTGAGDAFVGTMAARLHAGDSVHDATVFAVGAASLSTTREGSIPSLPTRLEYDVFYGDRMQQCLRPVDGIEHD